MPKATSFLSITEAYHVDCQLWTDCWVFPYSNMKFHQVNIQAFSPYLWWEQNQLSALPFLAWFLTAYSMDSYLKKHYLNTEIEMLSGTEENTICYGIIQLNWSLTGNWALERKSVYLCWFNLVRNLKLEIKSTVSQLLISQVSSQLHRIYLLFLFNMDIHQLTEIGRQTTDPSS